jgi:hypothetical protein
MVFKSATNGTPGNVIATAIQFSGTVFDLEECELCYAPQFGAAKDPVNYVGMIAANHLRGDLPLADWAALAGNGAEIVDVQDADESQLATSPARSTCRSTRSAGGLGNCPATEKSGSTAALASALTMLPARCCSMATK